ncbi:hypothetical protein F5878DRAFT_294591 [Lentinula raphanica]|uniref:Uncharacterized protein n=1 Tax=Lentinula raphanica TaxID=153919 RepID=A0AA38P3U9_9AGAR|nr:hypothetical protein F5878DRAFT_294591 [Lentinula raphanica]
MQLIVRRDLSSYLVYKPLPFVQGRAYLSNIRSAILESPRILKNPPSYYHTTPTFSDQTQRTFISPSTLPSTVQRSTSTSMIRVSQYQKLLRFVFLAGIAGTMTRVFGAPVREFSVLDFSLRKTTASSSSAFVRSTIPTCFDHTHRFFISESFSSHSNDVDNVHPSPSLESEIAGIRTRC